MRTSAILAVATVVLAACGYRLQQPSSLPPQMHQTAILASNPYSPLVRELTRSLSGANVKVVPSGTQAAAELHILQDTGSRRVLSVDSRDRPQEYELAYTVRFSLTQNGVTLLAPQTVTLTRNFVFNPNNVLAGNEQATRLLDAMRADIVRVVLRRLAAVKPVKPGSARAGAAAPGSL